MHGKPIKLTVQEVEGLEQVVSAGHKWIDGSNPAYPGLILKIGGAFLEAVDRGGVQDLYLSEQEAWYLREIVPANMRVRGESVGQSLKRKLYPLLLEFEAERYSDAAVTRYGSSRVEEPLTREDVFRQGASPEDASQPGENDAVHQAHDRPAEGRAHSGDEGEAAGEVVDADGQPSIDRELSDARDGAG